MIRLYVGGACQGHAELAREENPGCEVLDAFHEQVRRWMKESLDPLQQTESLLEKKDPLIIVANEVGCGIVPMNPEERAWRENVGRSLCRVADRADSVTRVICGIGVRLK